jgi:hypothetical protein
MLKKVADCGLKPGLHTMLELLVFAALLRECLRRRLHPIDDAAIMSSKRA